MGPRDMPPDTLTRTHQLRAVSDSLASPDSVATPLQQLPHSSGWFVHQRYLVCGRHVDTQLRAQPDASDHHVSMPPLLSSPAGAKRPAWTERVCGHRYEHRRCRRGGWRRAQSVANWFGQQDETCANKNLSGPLFSLPVSKILARALES